MIVDGDTLTRISRQYYGTANRWNEIFQANRDTLAERVQPHGRRLARDPVGRPHAPGSGQEVGDVGDLVDAAAAVAALEVGVLLGLHLDLLAVLLLLLVLVGDPFLLVEDMGHPARHRREDEGGVLHPPVLHELEEAGVELARELGREVADPLVRDALPAVQEHDVREMDAGLVPREELRVLLRELAVDDAEDARRARPRCPRASPSGPRSGRRGSAGRRRRRRRGSPPRGTRRRRRPREGGSSGRDLRQASRPRARAPPPPQRSTAGTSSSPSPPSIRSAKTSRRPEPAAPRTR